MLAGRIERRRRDRRQHHRDYRQVIGNDAPYLKPQDALKPLTDTDNVGLSYSDSMLRPG
ncbi:hypothetical protein GCM10023153_21250 [Ornithinibacter aureus]|uniref:Uncharacterized protein n=1 Tax=Ornithinibacter aureus TaxID=622664 RepID=A0ABP8JX58_9MICO